MGKVYVTVAGQHGTNAKNFYDMCPAVSVLPSPEIMSIREAVRVSPPTLSALLSAIVAGRDREIAIVSHASHTQLAMHVIRGVRIGVDTTFIDAILGESRNADLASRLRTRAGRVATLRSRIRQVQGLNLTRVEFRACRIGQSPLMLSALKRLFGAASVCAPRSFDGYGILSNVRPTTHAAALARWQQAHPTHLTFGTSPNRFFRMPPNGGITGSCRATRLV
jgi:hypothetical protein